MGHMMNWPLPSILLGHENMMIFVLVQFCLERDSKYLPKEINVKIIPADSK